MSPRASNSNEYEFYAGLNKHRNTVYGTGFFDQRQQRQLKPNNNKIIDKFNPIQKQSKKIKF